MQGIKSRGDKFHLILEPECVNVSFWYIPTRLRGVPHDAERIQELGRVCVQSIQIMNMID